MFQALALCQSEKVVYYLFFENDVLFQKVTQAYLEKKNPSAPIRS